jgi:predicted KAP-like P-loop ATPase
MSTAASAPTREKAGNSNISAENRTFADDRFGRMAYANHLNQLIMNSIMFKENESFTIALDASWGMGKTQFLHMWQHMLEQPGSPFPARVVYYNAWENDDCASALTPLIFHICSEYRKQKAEDENTLDTCASC